MTGPRHVVLVTGPPRSGVTGVVAALRTRLPAAAVVEAAELGPHDVPAAVVVVLSAVAPMTESDCRRVDFEMSRSDFAVGVVAKADAHRGWREVLAACSQRYRGMPWVPAAAAPDVGAPDIDELVAALHAGPRGSGRNTLRDSHVRRLRSSRTAVLSERRRATSERALALRGGLAEARAALGRFVRKRCVAMRTDFRARAAELRRGDFARFEADLLDEVESTFDELQAQLLTHGADLADALDVAVPVRQGGRGEPLLTARPTAPRHERRLTMVLGAGFGLGAAMAVSRLLGGLAHELTVGAFVVGAVSGLALTTWLVSTRALLAERALLDRWVGEVVTAVRWNADELVAGWLLAVEIGIAAELAARDEAEATRSSERIWAIDAELRGLTRLTASAQEE